MRFSLKTLLAITTAFAIALGINAYCQKFAVVVEVFKIDGRQAQYWRSVFKFSTLDEVYP